MPKRKKPEEKPEDQFKRFAETARELELDSGKATSAFEHLAKQDGPNGKRSHSRDKSK